jgi:hypothetical protein
MGFWHRSFVFVLVLVCFWSRFESWSARQVVFFPKVVVVLGEAVEQPSGDRPGGRVVAARGQGPCRPCGG